VLVFLSTFVKVHMPGDWDPRPLGSVGDIAKLRQRGNLNVLFILVDTLRADRLGMYGYERDTSPTLDRLASSGVRFARNLSQSSWTKASMASLWTSLYPTRSGISRFDQVLPSDASMPAEILKSAGFHTIGLYRNGWVAPSFGFDQGFDVYERPVAPPLDPKIRRENPTLSDVGTDESVIATAMEFLRTQGHERWFLYLHLMDLHEYIHDEESARFGTRYTDSYDNSIRWVDGVLSTLFAFLGDSGYLNNTLVILASDHGEGFGEHGFEGHARKLYREMTEVPWVLLFPFRLEPGVVVESRTQNVDLWPTVLDILGLPAPESDGRSRLPEILASARGEKPGVNSPTIEKPDGNSPAISHLDQTWGRPHETARPTVAVVDGPLRYVRSQEDDGRTIEQLFDATGDPAELRDRAREDKESLERLSKVADEYLEKEPRWGKAPTKTISEIELGQLRALGYAVP